MLLDKSVRLRVRKGIEEGLQRFFELSKLPLKCRNVLAGWEIWISRHFEEGPCRADEKLKLPFVADEPFGGRLLKEDILPLLPPELVTGVHPHLKHSGSGCCCSRTGHWNGNFHKRTLPSAWARGKSEVAHRLVRGASHCCRAALGF